MMLNRPTHPSALIGALMAALLMGCASPEPTPPTAVPATSIPATTVPATAVPATVTPRSPTAVPATAVPATAVPATATAAPPTRVPPTPTRAPTAVAATRVPTKTVSACAALPPAFMLATFGKSIGVPGEKPGEQYGGTECQYISNDALVIVNFTTGGHTMVQTMLDAAVGNGPPFTAVDGLGDEAWMAIDTGNGKSVAGSAIVAVKERVVAVLILGGYTDAVTRDKMLALSKVALGLK
ncbi:MAG: hypothetical protein KAX36_07555 [Thermoflexales bacterium]|nr:hypothetical protein [Thermoflexales bacterium]